MGMIRIAIATLGCKTNAAESAIIAGQFDPACLRIVPFEEEADIYIVNTCTVTGRTDYKSRNLIRKALARKQENPAVRVVVTGCYSQRYAAEVAKMGKVDLIVDNQNKLDIVRLMDDGDYRFEEIGQAREFLFKPVQRMIGHSRAFQKIQDGCDNRCAYCAVPLARGKSRSAAFADVMAQARIFAANGYHELVLGGVNLGAWHKDKRNLGDLILAIQELDGIGLIRLSSLEPDCITRDLLSKLRRADKLCPHFHIPLQSGSDGVLRRMGRHYTAVGFEGLMHAILNLFPDAALGLDVIGGFPGESVAEFEQTLALLGRLDIAYLHVFPYSRREGTRAASMPDQLTKAEIDARCAELSALGLAKKREYTERLISGGIRLRGVVEKQVYSYGTFLSDHYIRAYCPSDALCGELSFIVPRGRYRDGVR